jgi:hypothetical protein
MHYLQAYRFPFALPGGAGTVLLLTVCEAVPILGQLVVTGYALEWVERRRENDAGLPIFDVDRLSSYLTRGTWPFAVQLAILLPALLLCWLAGLVLMTVLTDGQGTVPRLVIAGLLPVSFLVVLLFSVILVPLTLHVGGRQQFDTADARSFLQDFLKRVGRETLLAQVFVTVTGLALTLLGAALVCLPALPALTLAHLAQYHLMGQLYALYLHRGGTRVTTSRPPLTT